MGKILDKIVGLFRKKEGDKNEREFQKNYQKLQYTGMEPLCFACGYPIHETERSRRVDGKRFHCKCFDKIKRLITSGKGINGF